MLTVNAPDTYLSLFFLLKLSICGKLWQRLGADTDNELAPATPVNAPNINYIKKEERKIKYK